MLVPDRLEKEGLITLRQLYSDGTKIEANENRYTFVWRGTLNYHLARLHNTIDTLYKKYNALLSEHDMGQIVISEMPRCSSLKVWVRSGM